MGFPEPNKGVETIVFINKGVVVTSHMGAYQY